MLELRTDKINRRVLCLPPATPQVPEVDPSSYQLAVGGEGLRTMVLSLNTLRTAFRKHSVTATLQCAGNRRSDLNPGGLQGTGRVGGQGERLGAF